MPDKLSPVRFETGFSTPFPCKLADYNRASTEAAISVIFRERNFIEIDGPNQFFVKG